jgi:hypothetical protein
VSAATPTPPPVSPYRIAFRAEGEFVNAYFAPPETMDGAILVSSVRRRMLNEDPELWEDWRTLMRMAFERYHERLGLPVTEWKEIPAPEHERSGEPV